MLIASLGFSQVKVNSNGSTKIGDTGVAPQSKLDVAGVTTSFGYTAKRTNAGATILAERTDKSAVIFGAGVAAGFTFDENFNFDLRRNNRTQILARQLSVGSLMFRGRGDTGFIGLGSVGNPSQQLHVAGNVFATSYLTPSDKNLKSNIEEFKDGLDVVLKMDVKSYNYNGKSGTNSKYRHVGVMAQQLEEIAPYLVTPYTFEEEDNDGNVISKEEYLSIHDSSIKYVLVNAIKDQQDLIVDQNQRIADLETRLDEIVKLISSNPSIIDIDISGENALLNQNVPNPFKTSTRIEFEVPANSSNVQMNIVDVSGKLIRTVNIEERGKGILNLNMSNMTDGTYLYNLIVDGKLISTKKMVLVK